LILFACRRWCARNEAASPRNDALGGEMHALLYASKRSNLRGAELKRACTVRRAGRNEEEVDKEPKASLQEVEKKSSMAGKGSREDLQLLTKRG